MFESLVKSKLKSIIKSKMVDNMLMLNQSELINLINDFTDNEFKIDLINGHEQHTTELVIQEYKK